MSLVIETVLVSCLVFVHTGVAIGAWLRGMHTEERYRHGEKALAFCETATVIALVRLLLLER